MDKKKFLYNLNDFQDEAIKNIMASKKCIIISKKFTGKSTMCGKLFNKCTNEVVIYHTGCCPELFEKAKKEFITLLKQYIDSNVTLILDEFYDSDLLSFISNQKNFNCYIFTNDNSLRINNFVIFNYYMFYKKFVINEVGKELNIHQVMNDGIDISKEKELLRFSSRETSILVRNKGKVDIYKMEI